MDVLLLLVILTVGSLSLTAGLDVLARRRPLREKLRWLLIVLLPVVGPLLYFRTPRSKGRPAAGARPRRS